MHSFFFRSIPWRYAILTALVVAVLLSPALISQPALAAENAPATPSAGHAIYLPFISMNSGGTGSAGEAVSPPIVFDPCGNPLPDGGTAPTECDPPSEDQ